MEVKWKETWSGCDGSYSRIVLVDEGSPFGLMEELEAQKTEGRKKAEGGEGEAKGDFLGEDAKRGIISRWRKTGRLLLKKSAWLAREAMNGTEKEPLDAC